MDSYKAIDISSAPDLHVIDMKGISSCLPVVHSAMFHDRCKSKEFTDITGVAEGVGLFQADDVKGADWLSASDIMTCGERDVVMGMADALTISETSLSDTVEANIGQVIFSGAHENGKKIEAGEVINTHPERLYKMDDVSELVECVSNNKGVHGKCLTDTGRTLEENLENVIFSTDQDVIYPVSKTITDKDRILLPKRSSALFSDCCFSDETEAAFGGPNTLIQDGDMISIKAGDELADEISINKPVAYFSDKPSFIHKAFSELSQEYSKQVGSAQAGAVTHPGGRKEVVCYADI
ncbi:MAG: hypothetical protein ACRBBN_06705 [Methyloligellaceae bacterium]